MTDLLYVTLTVALFAGAIGYAAWCGRLNR